MANCVCKLLSGLWAFVVASLRILLFIFCLLAFIGAIIQITSYYLMADKLNELDVEELIPSRLSLFQAIVSGVLALIGMHGTYSKDAKYIKLFALGMIIFSTVNLLQVCFKASQVDWATTKKSFSTHMKADAEKYQFVLTPGQEPNTATKRWDFLQRSFHCCGLSGPADWTGEFQRNQIPNSCCYFPSSSTTCTLERASRDGCGRTMEDLFAASIIGVVMGVFLNFVLVGVALIVAKKIECERASSNRSSSNGGNNQFVNPITSPVYVSGQPALNPNVAYYDQSAPEKQGSVYPNAYGVESNNSAPPPSYVARA